MTTTFSRRKHLVALAALSTLCLAGTGTAIAQNKTFPDRPIRLIVPYAPGGGSDMVARQVARKATEILGKSVVVDNRPGAGSTIGADEASRAAADGYTLLWGDTSTFAVNPHVFPGVKYDPRTAFQPIAPMISASFVLTASTRMGVKDLSSLITLLKANPGKYNYGTAGGGTPHHMAMESLKSLTGIDVMHIPYKGESPALQDLIGGNIDMMFAGVLNAQAQRDAGRLHILGASGSVRSTRVPEVPTLEEQGIKGYKYVVWHGIVAPAGTPASAVAILSNAFTEALKAPDVSSWILKNTSAEPTPGTAATLKATIATDYVKYKDIVKQAGIKPD